MRPTCSTTTRVALSLALLGQLVVAFAAPAYAALSTADRNQGSCGSLRRCACAPVVKALDQCCCSSAKSLPSTTVEEATSPCCARKHKPDVPAVQPVPSHHSEYVAPDRCRCEKPITVVISDPTMPIEEQSAPWQFDGRDTGRAALTSIEPATWNEPPPAPPPKA